MPETSFATASQPEPEIESQTPEEPVPDTTNEALIFCRNAYNQAYIDYRDSNGGPGKASPHFCRKEASIAYRDSMPTLSSRQNILNFMACVAEGMLLEAIPETTGSRLIYAAQAALAALPREPKTRRKTKKRTPLPPG